MRSQLNIRVDAETLARIKTMARDAGATLTKFVLSRCLTGKTIRVPEANVRLWTASCGHRSNLNQLTKRLHIAMRGGMIPSDLGESILAELKACQESDKAHTAALLGKDLP